MHIAHQYRLIDNSSEALSMCACLKACIVERGVREISIATGYWDILGMALVVDELGRFLEQEGTSLRLLIGKDPYIYSSLVKNPKYRGGTYPDEYLRTDIHDLELKERYEQVIALLLEHCASGKIEVRIYQEEEFLHAKCYIFKGKEHSLGIIGSSNFTAKGLLGNAELNYLETDATHVVARPVEGSLAKGHLCWFEEKWEGAAAWTQTFLEQVLKPSPIAREVAQKAATPFTPYELYIKLLHLQFGEVVDKILGLRIEAYFPPEIKKYTYQIDAVKRCIATMHEHGGFMLGDVVGLGKTVVATALIKYFLSAREEDGRGRKVLVISPPAIVSGWKDTIKRFFDGALPESIDFITTGRIDTLFEVQEVEDIAADVACEDFQEKLPREPYGLIVIDESHQFRNANTQMYHELDDLIQHITADTGLVPYIGLLSATPQNNRPDDLKNQLYLFERNRKQSTLKKAAGGDLEAFFARINKRFKELTRTGNTQPSEAERTKRREELKVLFEDVRKSILVDILERRTRTDLKQYYAKDMAAQGLVFPELIGPCNIHYGMDTELAQLFADTMDVIAPAKQEEHACLGYYRYRAIEFLLPEHQANHVGRGNRQASDVSRELAKLMQMLLVKRLESSFAAFKESLHNLLRYTRCMLEMWEHNTIFICPSINVNEELDWQAKSKQQNKKLSFADCVEALRVKIKGSNVEGSKERNVEYTRQGFDSAYYQRLQEDERLIATLCARWAENDYDPKLDAFKERIKPELFDPEKNTAGKLVIFSEAISTVKALERAVKAKQYRVLTITAANRHEKEEALRANFDANYPRAAWEDTYDVLITTEVLAEGVNLHRANVVVNYDTPWNATRLMQRIGRVNRIGTTAPKVYVYNFMPSAEGDAQIALVQKAYTKLQSFHVLFGEDSKIFSEEESLVHYAPPPRVASEGEAWQKLLDGEASEIQPYIADLKQYCEKHPYRYTQIVKATGMQLAQRGDGSAYFVLKATRGARLAFKIAPVDGGRQRVQPIALRDLLDVLRVDEAATAVPLPPNWETLAERAITSYRQYFVRMGKSRSQDYRLALDSVVAWYKEGNLSAASKELLERARRRIERGNVDIIRSILAITQETHRQPAPLTGASLDELLAQRLSPLVDAAVEERDMGEVCIELGTLK